MYILWVEMEAHIQEYFSHIKAIIKQRWVKTDMLREKHLTCHWQDLAFSLTLECSERGLDSWLEACHSI